MMNFATKLGINIKMTKYILYFMNLISKKLKSVTIVFTPRKHYT